MSHLSGAKLLTKMVGVLLSTSFILPTLSAYGSTSTPPGTQFKTRASWYGGSFHGRRTASGSRFDKNAMTAASPNLPFGTKVMVKNPRNGRTCQVTINDRGPYVSGRGIDLSQGAARKLGISGVSPVICYADRSAPGRYRTVRGHRTRSGGYHFSFFQTCTRVTKKVTRVTVRSTKRMVTNSMRFLGKTRRKLFSIFS